MGYTLYVDWLKKEIQMPNYEMSPEAMSDREENWDKLITIDEKMEREMFMEHCGEMGVPATSQNWAKFREHRQRVLAQWDKLTDERLARNGAEEVFMMKNDEPTEYEKTFIGEKVSRTGSAAEFRAQMLKMYRTHCSIAGEEVTQAGYLRFIRRNVKKIMRLRRHAD